MNGKDLIKVVSSFFLLIVFILKILVLGGCANQIPPTGGDRDSLPPILVRVTPPDSSMNFANKTITFTFDEFIEDVQQQNPFQNIIISPNPTTPPVVESRLRTMTVKLRDTLEANTTYYFNFGDVIKDVNERNILNNFSYIFSTGNTIDSLQLAGRVLSAETGEIDSTLVVMLFRNGEDSAIMKERPRYLTKVDGKGNFRFMYLPSGTYYIYAVKDNNGQRTYSAVQPFAFADSAVEIRPNSPPVILYAFSEKKDQPLTLTPGGSGINRSGRSDDRRLRFTSTLNNNTQDLLGEFALNFERPIRNLDTTKLQLSTDSTFNSIRSRWELDSLNKRLTLKINWQPGMRYNLILDKDFAEDTLGRKLLKTDTISFTTKQQADYGSIKVVFPNIDLTQNPVLQFSQNGRIVNTFPINGPEIYQQLFNPGEYDLSLLYDKNKNGRWDPGQFFGARRQPELVRPLNKKVTIRPNWDNEFEIKL